MVGAWARMMLIKAPMFVIDYAIFHELAKRAKAWLKENGQLLEQAI
jgi:hypothetical protein